MKARACAQCPWRFSNQGKRHESGFYTMANLRRLWGQIRRGGGEQSCHLTDPSHPDHVKAGAKPGATVQECPGSIIVVSRELTQMSDAGVISPESIARYSKARKKGLTRTGILYWAVSRIQFGGVPFVGGPKFPDVENDPEIGLPEALREG